MSVPAGVFADLVVIQSGFAFNSMFAVTFIRSGDGLLMSLNPGVAGNTVTCTASFFVEARANQLLIRVVENYGAAEVHHPPGLTVDAADDTHSGLLSWLRLWAAAWLDQAHRS